ELARQESEGLSRVEASHDGYARRFGFLHRRQLILASDGRELRGEDMLLPATKRRKLAATGFAVRFHLGVGVQVSPTADGLAALLRLRIVAVPLSRRHTGGRGKRVDRCRWPPACDDATRHHR
ncbi:heparinase II/III family protein, partial [Cutibacterium acnes]